MHKSEVRDFLQYIIFEKENKQLALLIKSKWQLLALYQINNVFQTQLKK